MKMLHKTSKNITKACGCMQYQKRGSALFVNGAKATESFTYVTPHVDFPDQLRNKDIIKENLIKRKSVYDLSKAANLWTVYEELKDRKNCFDILKDEISKEIGKLMKVNPEAEEVTKLKLQIGLVKDNIKKLKAPLWSAEEAAVVEALKLPNKLHALTPETEGKVIYTYGNPPEIRKVHLKIASELNLIHFKKNENYYLKNDAAIFELGAKFYFSEFLKKRDFIQFSNPDFVKSLVVEGCGEDHTQSSTFILHHNEDSKINQDSRLHLVGGASLASFFAYHTKNVIYPKAFPLKYFTMGRQYIPSPSHEDNLFNVSQSSALQLFGATSTENNLDLFVDELIETLKDAYKNLNYHFRLTILPAHELDMWESLRIALQMYSTSLNRYIEVANISVSGDFIPKRLLLTYVENKESKFPHIISGKVLNVPKFLGCVLEQDSQFQVPDQFKVNNWGNTMEN